MDQKKCYIGYRKNRSNLNQAKIHFQNFTSAYLLCRRQFFGLLGLFVLGCKERSSSEQVHSEIPISLGLAREFKTGIHDFSIYRLRLFCSEQAGSVVSAEAASKEFPTSSRKKFVKAVSVVCTHQTCIIRPEGTGYRCPCHGSSFDEKGKVLNGPAIKPLPWFKLSLGPEGDVRVHLSETVAPEWELEI